MSKITINKMKLTIDVNLNENHHNDTTKCHTAKWAVDRMTINSKIHRKITHRRTDSRMADSKKAHIILVALNLAKLH